MSPASSQSGGSENRSGRCNAVATSWEREDGDKGEDLTGRMQNRNTYSVFDGVYVAGKMT